MLVNADLIVHRKNNLIIQKCIKFYLYIYKYLINTTKLKK